MEEEKRHHYNTRKQNRQNYQEPSSEENTPPDYFKKETELIITTREVGESSYETKMKESPESKVDLITYNETAALKRCQKRISKGLRAIFAAAMPVKQRRKSAEPSNIILDLVQAPNLDNAIPTTSNMSSNVQVLDDPDSQIEEQSRPPSSSSNNLFAVSDNVSTPSVTEQEHPPHNFDRPAMQIEPYGAQEPDEIEIQNNVVTSSDSSFEAEYKDGENIDTEIQKEIIRIKTKTNEKIIKLKAAAENEQLAREVVFMNARLAFENEQKAREVVFMNVFMNAQLQAAREAASVKAQSELELKMNIELIRNREEERIRLLELKGKKQNAK